MSRVSQARSLGKYFLLVDNMLVVLGFFVVFPLISIRFVDQMGWAALMVGIALGLRQLVQQGLGIFGGAIADRFGAKPMIVTGMLMRAGGFAAMAEERQQHRADEGNGEYEGEFDHCCFASSCARSRSRSMWRMSRLSNCSRIWKKNTPRMTMPTSTSSAMPSSTTIGMP